MPPLRVCLVLIALAASTESAAGVVNGKLELPATPERPAATVKGFLDRVENPLTPVRSVNVGPLLIVVLEGEAKDSSAQVTWELAGESFARPVLAAPVGSEIVIKNTSRTSRALVAVEDPTLIQGGPINPTGTRSLRVASPKVYTIGDKDAPHLHGKLVVVPSPYIAYVEVTGTTGKFQLDVPEGTYKLRIFYKDAWIERPDETVTVPPKKGKNEVNVSVKLASYPGAAAPKK
jgi:hypothetical protein